MKRTAPSFDALVSAFRDLSATSAESAATRARVLERAGHEALRRRLFSPFAAPFAVVLAIVLSGAVLAAAGLRWRAPAPARIGAAEEASAVVAGTQRATRIVPALPAETASQRSPESADGERLAYERAHRAHFFTDAPARALAAWDDYLAAFPGGTFAPEARFNRALCLVRLERFAAAAEALRPFAAGRFWGYRRHEACLVLRWLSDRGIATVVEPHCAAEN